MSVSDSIKSLRPYQPGKPISELEREYGITNAIKLASNENPLGPSPKAIEAIRNAASDVHLYPDAAAFELRSALSAFHDVSPDEITFGNGSNEILNIVCRTLLSGGGEALMFDYAFIAYKIVLTAMGADFRTVPVQENFRQSTKDLLAQISEKTELILIANPNNPTGTHIGGDELLEFLTAVPNHIVVCIDEAYVQYAEGSDFRSALEFRSAHSNLIVSRTFSKCYALAGLRVGYAIASKELTDYFNRVREPFNTSLVSHAAALASLADTEFVARSVASNTSGREKLRTALEDLGLDVIPSQTNFMLVKVPGGEGAGAWWYEAMLRQGVIVRPVGVYGLPEHIRISIGTEAETTRCVEALRACFSQHSN